MSTLNERIKKLRKAIGLTQQEFAERLNIGRGTLANYEVGRNEPIDAVIALICKEFSVNEHWLRTGEGEMFTQQTGEDELAAAVNRLLTGETADFKKRLVLALSGLDEKHWVLLEKKLREIMGMQEPAPTLEQEGDAIAASARDEFIMEKKAEAASSALPSDAGSATGEKMA